MSFCRNAVWHQFLRCQAISACWTGEVTAEGYSLLHLKRKRLSPAPICDIIHLQPSLFHCWGENKNKSVWWNQKKKTEPAAAAFFMETGFFIRILWSWVTLPGGKKSTEKLLMHQIHTCGTRKDKIQDYKSIKKIGHTLKKKQENKLLWQMSWLTRPILRGITESETDAARSIWKLWIYFNKYGLDGLFFFTALFMLLQHSLYLYPVSCFWGKDRFNLISANSSIRPVFLENRMKQPKLTMCATFQLPPPLLVFWECKLCICPVKYFWHMWCVGGFCWLFNKGLCDSESVL